MTPRLFLFEGTWGGQWARPDHPFRTQVLTPHFRCRPVPWSYDADGVDDPFSAEGNRDWIAGGICARETFRAERFAEPTLTDIDALTHSHGLGPVLYQATHTDPDLPPPIPMRNVLAICPPPREEYIQLAREALDKGTIASLRVIYADGWDMWARFGQVGDGHWGWRRDWSALTHPRFKQRGEKGIGHSGLFEPKNWHRFDDGGDFAFLRAAAVLGV